MQFRSAFARGGGTCQVGVMGQESMRKEMALCGIWVSREGVVYRYLRDEAGGECVEEERFRPYAWADRDPGDAVPVEVKELKGDGGLNRLLRFSVPEDYFTYLKEKGFGAEFEAVRSLESQYLLEKRERMFAGLSFGDLRRLQLDIETACSEPGGFPDPSRKGDRVLAIGLRMGEEVELLELEADTDAAERELLKRFSERLVALDPDLIEGHNLFSFDLHYLYRRSKRFRLPVSWGRFGQAAQFRNSRLRVAERWLDFSRFDLPGRTVFDTYLMIQVFDITTRDLPSYGLKDVARYLGVTPEDGEGRTYIEGEKIQTFFETERERFRDYLRDDLRETAGVAEVLLPTYVAQAQNMPLVLQEICLRGTANKIDSLFLEAYFQRGHALPVPEGGGQPYEGGYTKSFEVGVFRHVLHFDVASLYPSILLLLDKNPKRDPLGMFIPLLRSFREYRLKYKALAREADDPGLQQEYQARQASFKILINSFYGYLGFSGARFGDPELASEVTARGRDLLKQLIAQFQEEGCTVLEADTDGIYVSSEKDWARPEGLLKRVKAVLPEGIDLEYDGSYRSMLCYKAKNYALYDGQKVLIRGSALRSRGIEPYLKDLTHLLIEYLLGVGEVSPLERMAEYEARLSQHEVPVEELAKSEYLSQNPETYRKKVEQGGKPRRAALEVAQASDRNYRMGDAVRYYVTPGEKGKTAAWQRARAVEDYDAEKAPYDPKYYQKKLKDWLKRYETFLETPEDRQQAFLEEN